MTSRHPKSRMVYCRVSEEEYQQLNSLCQVRELNSISALVRIAVRHTIDSGYNGVAPTDVDLLTRMVDRLSVHLQRIEGTLQSAAMPLR